eukprot:TRINITY_DN8019_c0_g1_i1.p1 TRINITY_DN8019_c0_g1~~TRINITY_DN8019_c0_g1_i1.p1  ORF type:complete len:139 (+),score=22.50 TRINITY_DN8019_c0_g1_i1:34-450(+)
MKRRIKYHPVDRTFLSRIAQHLNMKQHEDWYKIGDERLQRIGGKGLSREFLLKHLCDAFPEHEWDYSKLINHGFWTKKENHRSYFDWVMTKRNKRNGMDGLDSWYGIKAEEIESYGLSSMISVLLWRFNSESIDECIC